MIAIELGRWGLRSALRQPVSWLLGVLLFAAEPALIALDSVTLADHAGLQSSHPYYLVFLGLLAGQALTLSGWGQYSWLTNPLSRSQHLLGYLLYSTGHALLPMLALFLSCLLLGTPWVSWAGLLLTHLHLSAVGLLLAGAPVPARVQLALLPLLTWWLPSIQTPEGLPSAWLRNVVGAQEHLLRDFPEDGRITHWAMAFVPISGLYLAAILCRGPAHHALRHPR